MIFKPYSSFVGIISSFALIITIFSFSSTHAQETPTKVSAEEHVYLYTVRNDFARHRENITLINNIGTLIYQWIDSLFAGQRADTANTQLVRGIMVTRQYDRAILAYKDIINGSYISDPQLKLKIARHTARFEGFANSKRDWDNQWEITARPYIYKHGLFSHPGMFGQHETAKQYNLIRDPEFRTILWDRRMFAFDLTYITPILLESVDAIIERIDELISH